MLYLSIIGTGLQQPKSFDWYGDTILSTRTGVTRVTNSQLLFTAYKGLSFEKPSSVFFLL